MIQNNDEKTAFFDFFSFPHNPEDLFTLLYLIGKDQNHEFYKAINNETREVFCIEIISFEKNTNEKEKSKNEENLGIFQKIKQETLLLKSIKNGENIIQYYGSYLSFKFKNIWLIFEYCPGGSIYDLMKIMKRTLIEKEISIIMNDILHGLIYIHQLNVIHRNLKSTTILLNEKGKFKINNFTKSIQKLNNNDLFYSKNKSIEKLLDIKYDIFLLGITCIELFLEFKECNLNRKRIIEKLKNNNNSLQKFFDKELLNSNEKYISPEFIEFIQKCVEPNSNKRPTAFELSSHPFIKKYYNSSERENFINSLKYNIEKVEDSKKEKYNQNNRKIFLGNFYSSIYSKTGKTIKSNLTNNDKSYNNISNLGNENNNNTTLNVDKIAEFRIEQMKNGDFENDKCSNRYTNNDLYSNIDNTGINNIMDDSSEKNIKESAVFGKGEGEGEFEEDKSYEIQKKSLLPKNLFKKENEDNKIEVNQKDDLEENEIDLNKKDCEEYYFKDIWDNLHKYEDNFKKNLSDKNINYNNHILNFSEDSFNTEYINDDINNENNNQKKYIPFSDMKCDVIQLGSSVQKIRKSKKSNFSSEYSLKNSASKMFENNYMDCKDNINNIQKKFLLSFGNIGSNEMDINKKNDKIKNNKNDISTCFGSVNSPLSHKPLRKNKSCKQILNFGKNNNKENSINENNNNNEMNKVKILNLDLNDKNNFDNCYYSQRNKIPLFKFLDNINIEYKKDEINSSKTNIIKINKIFNKNKGKNNILSNEKTKNATINEEY